MGEIILALTKNPSQKLSADVLWHRFCASENVCHFGRFLACLTYVEFCLYPHKDPFTVVTNS